MSDHSSAAGPGASKAAPAGTADWAAWLDSYEGLPTPVAQADAARSTRAAALHQMLDGAGVLAPGLVLAAVIAFAAHYLADWTGRILLGFTRSPIGAIPAAIVLGALLRNTIGVPVRYDAGLRSSLRFLLRFGIVLLGLRLSLPAVFSIGAAALPVIVCSMTAAIAAAILCGTLFGLSARQGQLIAVGTGICGVSAIVAAAPVIDAKEDEIGYSVACVTLFGMIAMFGWPLLAHWIFAGDGRLAGHFLGAAIHDTAQVTGAALMYSQQFHSAATLDVATVTKLVRNSAMILLIPAVGMLHHRSRAGGAARRIPFSQAIPYFVLAYLGMAILRSAGEIGSLAFGVADRATWTRLLSAADGIAAGCLAIAMAAVGLGTDFARIRRAGWRPMAAGLLAALAAAAVSLCILLVFPPRL